MKVSQCKHFTPKTGNQAPGGAGSGFVEVSTTELNISTLTTLHLNEQVQTQPHTGKKKTTKQTAAPYSLFIASSPTGLCLSGVRHLSWCSINSLPSTRAHCMTGVCWDETTHILCLFYFKTQVNRSEVKGHTKHFVLVLEKREGKGTDLRERILYFHTSNKVSYFQNVTTVEVVWILA